MGQINLSSNGSNLIKFDNSGVGPPTATTRSAGTKLTFYSELGSGLAEYAMGIDAYTLWDSVPSTSPFQFQWLGGSTVAATLNGTGNLSVAGTLTAGGNAVHQALTSASPA